LLGQVVFYGAAHEQKKAKRSGEAGFGGSPPTKATKLARTPKKAKPSVASASEKEGFGGLP
jgi:hypothetical protein